MEGMHQPNNRMTLMGGVHQLPQISQATKKIGDEGGRAPAPTGEVLSPEGKGSAQSQRTTMRRKDGGRE
uniref:Uncharacterized protein n=1 Tax=Amphimedon queenslandica TaxID=400682 RepID=A0A1X7U1P2_AMPQE